MNIKEFFSDRGFWSVTARLAVPVAIQNVLTSSFQLVDTMMVSRLGDVELSSVGMAGQWSWLLLMLGFGLCSGMSVFVSQYWGVKDIRGIRRVLGIGICSMMLLSLLFLLVAFFAPEFVIRLFNRDPDVVKAGSAYLRIACFSYPAIALTNVLATALRNTERVKLPMYVAAITTVVNGVVNYILIFGKLGMPALGVKGAAVATCISSWLGPVLIFLFSAIEKNILIGPVKELLAFGRKNLSFFFRRALPVIFNEGMWALGTITLNLIYSNLGYEYYAGMTIFRTFHDLCFAFFVGLGNACVIMVGKSVGQGKIARGIADAKRFSVLVPLLSLVIGGLCIALRHPLISIFSTGDNLSALTLETALAVTVFCSAELVIRNIPYIQVVGIFRSGGDTLHGVIYDLVCLWLISIPLAYVAAYVLELPFLLVVVIAYLGEDIVKAFLCLRHFKSLRWLMPVTEEGRAGLKAYRESE